MREEKCSLERVSKKAVFPEEILFLRLSYLPAGVRSVRQAKKEFLPEKRLHCAFL